MHSMHFSRRVNYFVSYSELNASVISTMLIHAFMCMYRSVNKFNICFSSLTSLHLLFYLFAATSTLFMKPMGPSVQIWCDVRICRKVIGKTQMCLVIQEQLQE